MASASEIEMLQSHINVSRETIDRFIDYERELIKWNKAINLISKHTINEIWHRHFLDSIQVWQDHPTHVKEWVDIGSGAGFPGLVVAILASEHAPNMKITLVESDQRKASFLLHISKLMDLNVSIKAVRIENAPKMTANVISARALASISQIIDYSAPHLAKNGQLILLKGKTVDNELTDAQKYWKFSAQLTKSITDSGGNVVRIKDLKRINEQ